MNSKITPSIKFVRYLALSFTCFLSIIANNAHAVFINFDDLTYVPSDPEWPHFSDVPITDHVGVRGRLELAVALHVAVGVEDRAERRVLDRPALDLVHVVVDQRQRAAVRDDQHVDALLVLEADLARALQRQHAGDALAVPVSLGEVCPHRRYAAQRRDRLVKLAVSLRRSGRCGEGKRERR